MLNQLAIGVAVVAILFVVTDVSVRMRINKKYKGYNVDHIEWAPDQWKTEKYTDLSVNGISNPDREMNCISKCDKDTSCDAVFVWRDDSKDIMTCTLIDTKQRSLIDDNKTPRSSDSLIQAKIPHKNEFNHGYIYVKSADFS